MTAVVGDLREQTRAEEFAAVFAEHHQEVRRLAYALCGDWARADDAAAEAFARTWPKWRRGKVDDVRPYLRRTVVNHVRGRWRRRATERREEHHHRGDDRGSALTRTRPTTAGSSRRRSSSSHPGNVPPSPSGTSRTARSTRQP
ncbi:MAG: hypothetical protein M5U31_04820 [Acidimicrobiia bacterium]|nr:hypothetical protein [Acidimicrobiia bacterium]